MLGTVKSYISNLPDIPFNRYFNNYIMDVQDDNIENEMKFLLSRNTLNIYMMDNIISETYRRLAIP